MLGQGATGLSNRRFRQWSDHYSHAVNPRDISGLQRLRRFALPLGDAPHCSVGASAAIIAP